MLLCLPALSLATSCSAGPTADAGCSECVDDVSTSNCNFCNAGYYKTGAAACTACPDGTTRKLPSATTDIETSAVCNIKSAPQLKCVKGRPNLRKMRRQLQEVQRQRRHRRVFRMLAWLGSRRHRQDPLHKVGSCLICKHLQDRFVLNSKFVHRLVSLPSKKTIPRREVGGRLSADRPLGMKVRFHTSMSTMTLHCSLVEKVTYNDSFLF